MNRPQAVPVWLKISSDYMREGSDWITEEKQVDGLLRLEPTSLILEFEVLLSTTTMGSMEYGTETEDLGRHELEIPFDQLVTLSIRRSWWFPRLRIQTNRLSAFEGLPGAKRGVVNLRIRRRNVATARTLLAELEFARADLALRQVSRLEDPPDALLEGGEYRPDA